MRVLDLFSGIGGFALGFEQAGFDHAAFCEIDDKAAAVLAAHWPTVPNLKDVKEVTRETVESVGIDVITGGFPCQDVSVAGRRAGLAGERSGLWFEYHRIIAELKPQWVVIENVPGLLSSNGGADFGAILSGLVECGYGVCWRVFDAQYFGLAQRRRRVFIVGSLGDGRAAEVLFEREGVQLHPPACGTAREGATADAADGSGIAGAISNETDTALTVGSTDLTAVCAFDPVNITSAANRTRVEPGLPANTLHSQGMAVCFEPRYYTCDNKTGGTPSETADITNTKKAGDSAPAVVATATDLTHGETQSRRIYDPDGIAPNLQAEGGGGHGVPSVPVMDNRNLTDTGDVTHPLQAKPNGGQSLNHMPTVTDSLGVRRLTPTECERLQGFPDNWTVGQSDTARYKQLGNAVAVPVARWIAERIMAVSA